MGPVICMITDGRTASGRSADALVDSVAAAARAGVNLIQIRERDLDDCALLPLTIRCVAAVAGTRARVVVNDRLDVALAARAHGVHLRSDSYGARRVRRLAPAGFLVGRSIHGADDARRSMENDGLDYLIFGTVFETSSKAGRRPAGPGALEEVVRATAIPVLAVGGVTVENASLVARAGGAGIAAIGLFADAEQFVATTVERVTRAFDMPKRGS